MTPPELRAERVRRDTLIVDAARRNEQRLFFWMKVIAVTVSILIGWAKLAGVFHSAMFVYGLLFIGGPIMLLIGSVTEDSNFIDRQQGLIRQIELLLREREPFE